MGNCLVTKLKGSVTADLPKIGELKLHQIFTSVQGVTLGGTNLVIKTNGVGYFGVGSSAESVAQHLTEYTHSSGDKNYWFSAGEYDIIIENKYNINSIILPAPSSQFKMSTEDIQYSNIRFLQAAYGALYGKTENLKNIKPVSLSVIGNGSLVGTVDDFDFTNLTGVFSIGGTGIYGTIENFVAKQSVYRPSGETDCGGGLTRMTFGGVMYGTGPEGTTQFFVNWNSSTGLIYVRREAGSKCIWYKNATAEQISTWESNGYTVVEAGTPVS